MHNARTEQQWLDHLAFLSNRPLADAIAIYWLHLKQLVPDLPIPDLDPYPDLEEQRLFWKYQQHSILIDIDHNGPSVWFYWDSISDQTDTSQLPPAQGWWLVSSFSAHTFG